MRDKPSHNGQKRVRKSFESFGGQILGTDPAFCPQLGGHPDRCFNRVEPQHGEPVLKGPAGTDCPELRGTVCSVRREVHKSFFGSRRAKGKRGRGTFGKTIVFGLFKQNGKVYTEIVPNYSRNTL